MYDVCPILMVVGESETGMFKQNRHHSQFSRKNICSQMCTFIVWPGHLMKTKSTSDSIYVERCCKSTLPIVLDVPKCLDARSELLIDFCSWET